MKKDWIKRLPPGEYDMNQIKEFAGLLSHSSTKIILLKYGAKVKRVSLPNSNFYKDVFIWKGFKPTQKKKKEPE